MNDKAETLDIMTKVLGWDTPAYDRNGSKTYLNPLLRILLKCDSETGYDMNERCGQREEPQYSTCFFFYVSSWRFSASLKEDGWMVAWSLIRRAYHRGRRTPT